MRYRLLIMGVLVAACHGGPGKTLAGGTSFHVGAGYPRRFALPDESSVLVMPNTTVALAKGFGKENRDMEVDGEVMLEVSGATSLPFRVHTRDLVLEVLDGGARFHVDANRSRPGEEADLLEGRLRASKSYHSDTDNEPEVLNGGEMVMINRDIDLMEKEKLGPAELDKLKGKQ
ncbi:FecR domain-containing protein [Puia sp.]|jgi:ferric-dicitrate binding protein FerR (iron transport regulator)|uniref:FecR domain-containing protein n=1 Tax=Puia sp. TaxID=2045100 RepID=UPI002F42FAF9